MHYDLFVTPETRAYLDAFFAENFEVSPDALSHERTLVRRHPRIYAGYAGAQFLRTPSGYLLTVPPDWVDRASRALHEASPVASFDVRALIEIFGNNVDVPIGPSIISYADESDFRPADTMHARLLAREDAEAMIVFREACDPLEWNHGGAINPVQHPTFAVFVGDAIVAAASYDYQGDRIRHVGFITHPHYRSKGYGRGVASAVTAYGLAEGGIMQWQTLTSNVPSFRVGQSLGYQPWIETIAIRLKD
jgi:GNAT superfamily N-acetyltransferase